jgi:SOS-response transcriptional repressors (RecA-mediated autopeptidases)
MDFIRSVFAGRLRSLMEDKNDTVYSLGESVFLSPGTISKYLNEKIDPRRNTIESIAKHYKVNPIWLMGSDQVDKYIENEESKIIKVPILGNPENKDDILGYEYVNSKLDIKFCLYAKDDSMVNSRILTNDLLYLRHGPAYESGDIVLVKINGEAPALKRIYKTDDFIILKSDNLANQDERIFSKKDLKSIEILGKMVMFRSEVRK